VVLASHYRDVDSLNEQHIRELHALYQGEWWTAGRSLDEVRRMLENTDVILGVCGSPGERLVGFARVLTDTVFKALILDVIVAPDCRQDGLGRHLMERIVRHPALADVNHFELYCLPELVPFYEKWGFSTDVAGVTFMRRTAG
jgi:predicted GNAT family N-acyltransferase